MSEKGFPPALRANKNGFRGIFINGPGFGASIGNGGKRKYLGQFLTRELAAAAFDAAAVEAYGARARLNFPRNSELKATSESMAGAEFCDEGHAMVGRKLLMPCGRVRCLECERVKVAVKRAQGKIGCICPGDATPFCQSQACPRKST